MTALQTAMLRQYLAEKAIERMFREGKISGTVHLSFGQEYVDNAVVSAFTNPLVFGNHRLFGPGCMLSGSVTIGDTNLFVAGCLFEPRVEIGSDCVIPSGTVIVGNIPSGTHIKAERAIGEPFYSGGRRLGRNHKDL